MYRILSSVLLVCLLQPGQSQTTGKAFTVTGIVTNTPSGYVYLNYIDSANLYIRDSSKLIKGRFAFSGYINGPVMADFHGLTNSNNVDDPRYTSFFIEQGVMQATFHANDFKHGVVTGSKSQTVYTAYTKQIENLDKKWKTVLHALTAYKEGVDIDRNKAIIDEGLPLYQEEFLQIRRQFIRLHPESYASSQLLIPDMYKLSLDSLKIYFNRLSPAVRNGYNGRGIQQFIQKEETIAVGQPAPDFMQPDTSGTPVWLHDYKGKYVLVDIWASWCKPCREEHPELRRAFEKYGSKGFVILSISMDKEKDKAAWLSAIAKDSLTWPQLCDFKMYQNTVVQAYNVLGKGIPANFLISPEGIILAINLRGEEVEKKLALYIK